MRSSSPVPTRKARSGSATGELPQAVITTLKLSETLLSDGYIAEPTAKCGVFRVTTPERWDSKAQEYYTITYTVDVLVGSCNCQMWENNRVCKHVVALRRFVLDRRERMAKLLAEMALIFEQIGELGFLDRAISWQLPEPPQLPVSPIHGERSSSGGDTSTGSAYGRCAFCNQPVAKGHTGKCFRCVVDDGEMATDQQRTVKYGSAEYQQNIKSDFG